MIAESTPETADQYPTGPGGFVYATEFVKARDPDAVVEERKAKGGYGYSVNVVVVATVTKPGGAHKRQCIGLPCRDIRAAYESAAKRLGWSNGMTAPAAKAGDRFDTPGGVMRAFRVYWHTARSAWVIEFDRDEQGSATPDLSWEPLDQFLKTATPHTEPGES